MIVFTCVEVHISTFMYFLFFKFSVSNVVLFRFSQKFVDRVANPKDIVYFHRRRIISTDRKSSNSGSLFADMSDSQAHWRFLVMCVAI